MSYVVVTLAGAETPGEHLQPAVFTAAVAVLFIGLGWRQLRNGRHAVAPGETVRAVDRLVPPSAPRRMHRTTGGLLAGFGCLFLLPALFNLVVAIRELIR
ncbi:hypothetical protein [Streptomyces griseorubiginosus]|uniref:hypothetical protein n=1 Tax=Streptomyces griseorubiginosus TaxID=67304 RepID=UPI0011401B3E|nr:hypothetical protein [Streptomyces griseorubiginosus]